MLIVEIPALLNGAHHNQTCDSITPPDGWAVVPPELEEQAEALLPFVTLSVLDGVITAVSDNTEARAAAATEPKPAAPTDEVAVLKAKVAALTQSNANLEECLVEMAGIVYA